jgi:hypothetical protein
LTPDIGPRVRAIADEDGQHRPDQFCTQTHCWDPRKVAMT